MPDFKDSTGYKMKGSTFYGHGNQSPIKAVDQAVIDSQKSLGETENAWKSPGWTKVAKAIVDPLGGKKSTTKAPSVAETVGAGDDDKSNDEVKEEKKNNNQNLDADIVER